MNCGYPNCSGSIVDGYCDQCGMPPLQPHRTAASPADSAPRQLPSCSQQDCPGKIIDGYCDLCGVPVAQNLPSYPAEQLPQVITPTQTTTTQMRPIAVAESHRSPSIMSQPATHSSPVLHRPKPKTSEPCNQPGCRGKVADGYCDTCGAPAGASPLSAAEIPAAEPIMEASALSLKSNRLGSTALGSARATGSGNTRRVTPVSDRLRTAGIGQGLTSVPPAPEQDPRQALMINPLVPENKRNCPSCGNPVGRARENKPGRTHGFCPNCRARFDFEPKLKPGDLVANQYEVQGALAHGGMGWVYLARDRNVSGRWVVLKGLLNSEDPDLVKATISEQQFLAQVSHPMIVEIYNFVQHDGAAYIVMEYVGGRSLKQLLKERMRINKGAYHALPVDQAIAFIVEILPAIQYLHDKGLIYCDFKPDNVIQVEDSVKLIDLGGVRRIDDQESAIYGTAGYQAPEIATVGPSIASDLYTIGRSLVVLCAEFRGYQSTYQFSIPSPDEMPLFAQHDSLYRLILKCCAPDPNDRFSSANELRIQLLGILREEVGAKSVGISKTSHSSLLFDPPTVSGDSFDWHQLPILRVDASDPMYSYLSQIDIEDPVERLTVLAQAPGDSAEIGLARCLAALEMNNQTVLKEAVNHILVVDPWEWRAVWMGGMGALLAGDWKTAQSSFNAVYGQVPGELAPKLALAVACEQGGEDDVAETLYTICASTDANYVTPAGFGLARIRARRGDLEGALAALDMVPTTSRGFSESRRLRAQHLVTMGNGLHDLSVAMSTVHEAKLDAETQDRYQVQILQRALTEVRSHGANPSIRIGHQPADEAHLKESLESAYRQLAKHISDPAAKTVLIDNANQTRKWTLL